MRFCSHSLGNGNSLKSLIKKQKSKGSDTHKVTYKNPKKSFSSNFSIVIMCLHYLSKITYSAYDPYEERRSRLKAEVEDYNFFLQVFMTKIDQPPPLSQNFVRRCERFFYFCLET